jgi:hypothetical protein
MGVRFSFVFGRFNDVGIILLFWACTICNGQFKFLYGFFLFLGRGSELMRFHSFFWAMGFVLHWFRWCNGRVFLNE